MSQNPIAVGGPKGWWNYAWDFDGKNLEDTYALEHTRLTKGGAAVGSFHTIVEEYRLHERHDAAAEYYLEALVIWGDHYPGKSPQFPIDDRGHRPYGGVIEELPFDSHLQTYLEQIEESPKGFVAMAREGRTIQHEKYFPIGLRIVRTLK